MLHAVGPCVAERRISKSDWFVCVFATVMILSVGLAAFAQGISRRNSSICASNVHLVNEAALLYATDYDGTIVPQVALAGQFARPSDYLLSNYVRSKETWTCSNKADNDGTNIRTIGMNRALLTAYDGSTPDHSPVRICQIPNPSEVIQTCDDAPRHLFELPSWGLRSESVPNVFLACLGAIGQTSGSENNPLATALSRHEERANYALLDGHLSSYTMIATIVPKIRWFVSNQSLRTWVPDGLTSTGCTMLGSKTPYVGRDPVTGN